MMDKIIPLTVDIKLDKNKLEESVKTILDNEYLTTEEKETVKNLTDYYYAINSSKPKYTTEKIKELTNYYKKLKHEYLELKTDTDDLEYSLLLQELTETQFMLQNAYIELKNKLNSIGLELK